MKATIDPRPIPGAIDGHPWDVRVSPPQALGSGRRALGATNARERQMFVPPAAANPALARWVALHELGHAKWTPTGRAHAPAAICRKHAPATEQDVQVVEDLRINSLLHRAGLLAIPKDRPEDIAPTAAEWARAALKPEQRGRLLEALTLAWVQCGTIDCGDRVARLDSAPVGREHKALLGAMHRAAVDLAATVPGADAPEAVRDALANLMRTAEAIGRDVSKLLAGDRGTKLPFARVGKAAAHLRRCLLAAMAADEAGADIDPKGKLSPMASDDIDTAWGDLRPLPALALTESTPAEAAMRKRVGVPAGTRIGSLRRLLTDGRCFRRDVSRPAKGGTVLIDTSGSMHLDPADVHAILAELPAATVAIYSGRQDGGSVSVIARNGRTASAKAIKQRVKEVGGGNIIDGPALQWLGQQPEPRHWVCDGIVTGCGDATTKALQLEAEALRRRGRILRSESLNALTRRLSGKDGTR